MVDKSSHYEFLGTYVDDIVIWIKDPMAFIHPYAPKMILLNIDQSLVVASGRIPS
jgi:hypothetical protein